MQRFYRSILCIALLLCGVAAIADEGMWLFSAFPKDKLKAKYGFEPTQAWLDHVRMSSVRVNVGMIEGGGGSGSFVSPDGLIMTNHHIASGCIHAASTNDRDYMKQGFYAPTHAEEIKCRYYSVSVLRGVEDITAKVNAAAKPDTPSAAAAKSRSAAALELKKACSVGGFRCDVVTLYSGTLRRSPSFVQSAWGN